MFSLINQSVLKTVAYAAYFSCPVTDKQIYKWLISSKIVDQENLKQSLSELTSSHKLKKVGDYYTLSSLCIDSDLLIDKQAQTQYKKNLALSYAKILSRIPSISFVALTGSIAADNANLDDDIDLMIVTSKNSLWLTRVFVTLITKIFYKHRSPHHKNNIKDAFCLNLWLEETSLAVPTSKHSLYTAHEVLQILPLYDRNNTYQNFLRANKWVTKYLANAYSQSLLPIPISSHRNTHTYLFTNRILSLLNLLLYHLQYSYMKPKITKEYITTNSAYFHPQNVNSLIDKHINSSIND